MTPLTEAAARALLVSVLADIAPEVDLDQAPPGGQMQQELGLDSMDFLNLMIGIQERTGLRVPERDYPALSTVEGAIAYLLQGTA